MKDTPHVNNHARMDPKRNLYALCSIWHTEDGHGIQVDKVLTPKKGEIEEETYTHIHTYIHSYIHAYTRPCVGGLRNPRSDAEGLGRRRVPGELEAPPGVFK